MPVPDPCAYPEQIAHTATPEEDLSGWTPPRRAGSRVGHSHLPASVREGPHVDLEDRVHLVGLVGHPSAVRRDRGVRLVEWGRGQLARVSLGPAGGVGGERPEVPARLRAVLLEHEPATVGGPRARVDAMRPFAEE